MTKSKGIWALGLLAAAVVLLGGVWLLFAQRGAPGEKTITVAVQPQGGSYTIVTDAAYLREALEQQQGLIAGEEGPYGLYITAVEGREADESKNEYWMLTKDGEQTTTGVDSTPIADGDRFELTLTTFG